MFPAKEPQMSKFDVGRSLHETLWQFQQSCQFTDLTLSCSDGTLPAHRAMLAGVFKLLGIAIDGQDGEVECLVIPDVVVSEVEQALEELYIKSESVKLLNLFCCTKVKSEIVDVLSIFEVKPEVPSDEEFLTADQVMEYEDDDGIKQDLSEFKDHTFVVNKPIKKNANHPADPLNPLNAKNPFKPKHVERIKTLTCDQCDHIARDVKRLLKHKSFYHENLKHHCEFCDFKTATRKEMESHRNEVHPDWKLLKTSMRGVRKLKKLTCDQCDFVAKRPESLPGHKKREHGEKYPCDECEKSYLNPDKLEVHKKYAHDKTIRQCDQCPYQTNDKWALMNHHRIKHTDECYYCDQCDFNSKCKNRLKVHVETKHEGRRFYCEQCDYSAPYKGGLLRHIKMVHEGVTYQCDFCEHKATTRSNLKLHVDAKHLGIKYSCDMCDYQASQPGSLKIHKQTRHSMPQGQ